MLITKNLLILFKYRLLCNNSQQNIFINIPKLNDEIELKTKLRDNAIEMLNKAIENSKTE